MSSEALENLMTENRRCELYAEAQDDRLGFWAEQARPLDDQPFSDVLDWSKAPFAEWFVGGRLNVAVNCVDRHVAAGHGDQVAVHFEGEPGDVSGHNISTTEVESAMVSHPSVAEAAGVGAADPTIGQGIVAFVIVRAGVEAAGDRDAFAQALRDHVAKEIGPIAKPRQILVVTELPKTRSGKIMRRLLRDRAENPQLGDVTALSDPAFMNLIGQGLASDAGDG